MIKKQVSPKGSIGGFSANVPPPLYVLHVALGMGTNFSSLQFYVRGK